MCLSTIYKVDQENQKKELCSNIMSIKLEAGKIICTNILGVQTIIDGEIDKIDLMDNFVIVKDRKS